MSTPYDGLPHRTASGLYVANDRTVANLRNRGFSLPGSNVHARIEARRVVEDVQSRETAADIANRALAADMRRRKLESSRVSTGSGMQRTAANFQMALPKVRQPMGSLVDMGIPFNTQDPKELVDLRRWCRLFLSTHPLIPLLIEIYSTFPVSGLSFTCKDPQIEEFYTSMFLDDLNYEDFLPNGLMREYFTVGEVTSLSHFNEELGTWASEEILNPDQVKITKSMFVQQERVQLLVKDMVEALRDGPQGDYEESHSEKLERNWEYGQLVAHYPEIIKAAQQDDGLDISDALVSRMVNKAAWWDNRGTPYMLRCFRDLMMEESLHAAENAVCDRLYAPMILATLGIDNMGENGEPWVPNQGTLDELRDDIQSALAADFKVLVHNQGLNVSSVFGRESVPNFAADYERVYNNIMQAWGIGAAMLQGGSGAGGTYASSAINREIAEQLMRVAQNKVKAHLRKKMEVIAEAQEHYDYELKGGVRKAIYREIEEFNEETGETEVVEVPQLLIPDVEFATLNLRDESTERAFLQELKNLGVPITDDKLALGVNMDFQQQLEGQADETFAKGMAQAQVMDKLQKKLDADGLAYPSELVQFLQATLQIRQMQAQTETLEAQNKMADQQLAQASPAGMLGLLPGTTMQPLAGIGMPGSLGGTPAIGGLPPGQGGDPSGGGDPAAGASADPTLGAGAPAAAAPQQMAASMHGPQMHPPVMAPPGGIPAKEDIVREMPRNRGGERPSLNRPEESDEMREGMPKQARRKIVYEYDDDGHVKVGENGEPVKMVDRPMHRYEIGPSSYGSRRRRDAATIQAAVDRRARFARGRASVKDLIHDRDFWSTINMGAYEGQILADFPEIEAGGAPESKRILDEALQAYEEVTGVEPEW